MKPFPNVGLNNSQKHFNKCLSSARVTVERAFGFLKGRWRCLMKRLDNDIENVAETILAGFVLHNLKQIRGEAYVDYDNMLDEIIQEERAARHGRQLANQICDGNELLRNTLANFIYRED